MFAPYLTKFILSSRKKPAMYWGDRSLKTIACNIDGFDLAIRTLAPKHEDEIFPKLAFTFYVAARLKRVVGGHAWYTFLLETYPDDGTAQQRFFAFFDEFATSWRCIAQRRQYRILRYPKVRGYFVIALPALDWGEFCHYSSLKKARAEFLKLEHFLFR